MPNNIPISLGSGASLATDQVGGLHYPYTKIASGVAGEENYLDVDAAGSAQVAVKGNITIDQVDVVTAVTDITNPIALKGNVTISDSKGFIGLVSVSGFTTPLPVDATGQGDVPVTLAGETVTIGAALPAGNNNIGNVDIASAIPTGSNTIGNVGVVGNVTVDQVDTVTTVGTLTTITNDVSIDDGGNSITVDGSVGISGNVTVDQVDVVTAVTDITNPVALKGNLTVSISGPAQTVIPHSIAMSDSSIATIAVPTNTFKITSMVLNSDATVRVSVKSGATYLTGNASIGITLNPGGGFVKDGSMDSPSFTGLADAEAIVIEKFDMTGTAANVGGYVSYYED